MVLPCPICKKPVDAKNRKYFPDSTSSNRYKYCVALGVPEDVFRNVQTRRYICLNHFDDDMFIQRNGKTILKSDALPRTLSYDERLIVFQQSFSHGRFQRPSMPSDLSFEPLSPALPSPSTVSPSLPSGTRTDAAFSFDSQGSSNLPSTSSTVYQHSTSTVYQPSTSTVYPSSPIPEFDYIEPPADNGQDENGNVGSSQTPQAPKSPPKYVMVQHDKLMELCRRCYRCGHTPKSARPSSSFCGTACKITLYCSSCEDYVEWESQDRIPERNIYKGNIEIASAIASSSLPFATFLQFAQILSLAMIDHNSYYRYMPTFWTVVGDTYTRMQKKVFDYLQQKKEPINLAADGQYDTRGFSAYMCCVTFMDAISRLIVTTVCLDKSKEHCPSNDLERRGVERGLRQLIYKGLNVFSLTTDRSRTVIAMMKSNFPDIVHMYDPWHLIKGIAAILRKENKNARAATFKDWCQAILNQLWYSVTSANGNGKLCQQYAVSALLHSMGIHEWESGKMSEVLHNAHSKALGVDPEDACYNDPLDLPGTLIHKIQFEEFMKCAHQHPFTETATKTILCPLSKSYHILQKAFTNDNFLNDLLHLSPQLATSSLEGFHGLVSNNYRTKNHYFDLKGFTNRTKLAVLHYNNNVFDELNGTRRVIGQTQLKAKHRGGDMVTKKRKTPTDFTWKKQLIADVLNAFENKLDVLLDEGIFDEGNEQMGEDDDYEVDIAEEIDGRIDDMFDFVDDVEEC